MANYFGSARSNHFQVKDLDAFTDALPAGVRLITGDNDTVVLLGDDGDSGTWPSDTYDEELEDHVPVDVPAIVAEHLADGWVAVFMEIGAEKLRYLVGHAVAVNSKGEVVYVNLEREIMDRAKGLGDHVTPPTY